MKIHNKSLHWNALSNRLQRFLLQSTRLEKVESKPNGLAPAKNQFKSLRCVKPPLAMHDGSVEVDSLVLEKFVKAFSPSISYHGFIASHLQIESIDESLSRNMNKKLAIERMVALLNSTIADTKNIELNQISHCKG